MIPDYQCITEGAVASSRPDDGTIENASRRNSGDAYIVNKIRGWTRPPYFTTDSTACCVICNIQMDADVAAAGLHPGGLAALGTREGAEKVP